MRDLVFSLRGYVMTWQVSSRGQRTGNSAPRNTTYHFVHPSKFFPVVVPESHGRSAPPQLLLPEVYDKAMHLVMQ